MEIFDIDFKLLLINSLFCMGLIVVSEPDKLLRFLQEFFLKNNLLFIGKPIILCATCMASLWGSVFYWLNFLLKPIEIAPIYELMLLFNVNWIVYCIILAFVNTVIYYVYDFIKRL